MLLDIDLARLYGVNTASLNGAVRRNLDRFPADFMFQLDKTEVLPRTARYLPYAFTEQGVAMRSSVLRSERAVIVNIAIMRTFVQLREMLATNQQLRRKIEEMEKRYDAKFQFVFDAIKRMLQAPKPAEYAIGFMPPGHAKPKLFRKRRCV